MKIVNEIREDRVYYYLPKSEEELRETVKLGTFDDVIKTAKCLSTWVTSLDDAKKIIAELPEKHLVFEPKLNKDSMIFLHKKRERLLRNFLAHILRTLILHVGC